MTSRRRCATLLVALVAALALATAAGAEIVTRADTEGRTITFDVQAPSVDVDWYAAVLRAAAHGDEISRVTIRIVPRRGRSGAVRRRRGRVLLAGRKRREDGRPRRQGHQGRSDVPARVRAPPRPLVERGRRARAERDARVVAASRHGRARCAGRRRLRLLARLEPQRRRDLRRGLRLDPHPVPARDPVALAARRGASHRAVRGARRPAGGAAARDPRGGPARDQPERHARGQALAGRSVRPARARPPRHA